MPRTPDESKNVAEASATPSHDETAITATNTSCNLDMFLALLNDGKRVIELIDIETITLNGHENNSGGWVEETPPTPLEPGTRRNTGLAD